MISRAELKLGHIGSKTRSLGQILEKQVQTIEGPEIIQALYSTLKCWFHKIMAKIKTGSCQIRTRSNLGHNLMYTLEGTGLAHTSWTYASMFIFIKSKASFMVCTLASTGLI